jgi:hypothetical protein
MKSTAAQASAQPKAPRRHRRRPEEDGNWIRRAPIERLCGRGREAVVEIGGCEYAFPRVDNIDFYLVSTDDFSPLVAANSVIEVWTSDWNLSNKDLVLVAGQNRLEVRRFSADCRAQVLGSITRIETWPAGKARHYVN